MTLSLTFKFQIIEVGGMSELGRRAAAVIGAIIATADVAASVRRRRRIEPVVSSGSFPLTRCSGSLCIDYRINSRGRLKGIVGEVQYKTEDINDFVGHSRGGLNTRAFCITRVVT